MRFSFEHQFHEIAMSHMRCAEKISSHPIIYTYTEKDAPVLKRMDEMSLIE